MGMTDSSASTAAMRTDVSSSPSCERHAMIALRSPGIVAMVNYRGLPSQRLEFRVMVLGLGFRVWEV